MTCCSSQGTPRVNRFSSKRGSCSPRVYYMHYITGRTICCLIDQIRLLTLCLSLKQKITKWQNNKMVERGPCWLLWMAASTARELSIVSIFKYSFRDQFCIVRTRIPVSSEFPSTLFSTPIPFLSVSNGSQLCLKNISENGCRV